MNDSSDIAQGDWIDRKVPAALQPYFRLARVDRPIGVWLLAIPCWWGLGLAFTSVLGATLEEIGKLALLFLMGSFLMRGAGCTWNDILDRDIDAKVARTANRPLASGRLRLGHAAVFLVLLLTLSALILLALNDFTILLAVSSLALVTLYPLMKRITYWPQAFLGLTFNWGVLVGWATLVGENWGVALAVYLGCALWTVGYDTIYAVQDREDDALVGIRSSALRMGGKVKQGVALCYGGAIFLWALGFWLLREDWVSWITLLPVGWHLAWQVVTLDESDSENPLARFRSNRWAGFLLAAACFVVGNAGV